MLVVTSVVTSMVIPVVRPVVTSVLTSVVMPVFTSVVAPVTNSVVMLLVTSVVTPVVTSLMTKKLVGCNDVSGEVAGDIKVVVMLIGVGRRPSGPSV